jgi:hypothetical protein
VRAVSPSALGRGLVFITILAALRLPDASAQLVASGKSLTVTTTNSVATLVGADLVGFQNLLTNELYLKKPSAGELAAVNTIANTGQSLQTSNWTVGSEAGTGIPLASITVSDSIRTLTLTVKIDPSTQETVIKLASSISTAGLRDASWSIAGMDLAGGRLIIPGNSGVVFDKAHSPLGQSLEYPSHSWNAQMGVYEGAHGSFLFYSTDTQMRFKQLRSSTRGSSTVDLAIVTEAVAPFTTATSVPAVEWRLKAFSGDWRTAAQVYRDWLAVNRPPVSNSAHPWVADIHAVVEFQKLDETLLAPLAQIVVPSQTLLFVTDWRFYAFDVNYPDYTPRSGVASFITAAHALGFKVMLHFDLIGVSPGNSDYAGVQGFQARASESLQLLGWVWERPPSTPNRFAIINPASSAYRALFISRVTAAVNAVHPDALHLDFSGDMFNDGNGQIEGLSYPQGSAQLHEDVIAAFPSLALDGEGANDVINRYESFAQANLSTELQGHPIVNFLLGSHTQFYGQNGQPHATEPSFKAYLSAEERRAVLPQLAVSSVSDLDTTNLDNARLIALIQSWQSHAFQPDWNSDWAGALVRYQGTGNTTASLTDSGTLEALTAAGSTLYQLSHDLNRLTTTSFIPNWPAFDDNTLSGLDPTQKYWLVSMARPTTTHVTSLPDGVRLGSSVVSSKLASVEVDPLAQTAVNFYDVLNAVTGVRFQGTDGPLANGAVVNPTTSTVGGVSRQALFIVPPFQGQVGGETFVEYAIAIATGGKFQFSAGLQDNASCNVDGVTFRITVNGAEAFHQNYGTGAWHDGAVDLSAYANSTIALRLISNPGPQNNPNCDRSAWSQLQLIYPPAALISVPLALANGSTFSGFAGDGSVLLNSPQAATVSGVPLPGRFTVFTQAGTIVSSGTNLANIPFDTWKSLSGFAEPGSVFNAGSVGSATSGGVTKNPAIDASPPDGGSTILSWVLQLPAGSPLHLGWSAGIRDAFTPTIDGIDFIVRINGLPYWQLTKQTDVWSADGIDLQPWQGQNVLVQLITDSRTNNNYDFGVWADLILSNSNVNCAYSVTTAPSAGAAGGQFSLNVTAPATCPWFVKNDVPWLSIVSGGSGLGNGTVSYLVSQNSGPPRSVDLIIADKVVRVDQGDSNGVLLKRPRAQITSQ